MFTAAVYHVNARPNVHTFRSTLASPALTQFVDASLLAMHLQRRATATMDPIGKASLPQVKQCKLQFALLVWHGSLDCATSRFIHQFTALSLRPRHPFLVASRLCNVHPRNAFVLPASADARRIAFLWPVRLHKAHKHQWKI